MFFFLVGGVEQAAGQLIKSAAGKCVRCGGTADIVESEKVLKLFFVPVWRWRPKNQEFLYSCRDCGFLWPQSIPIGEDRESIESPAITAMICDACKRNVEPEFRFCPYCGAEL